MVPFCELSSQFKSIEAEIRAAIDEVHDANIGRQRLYFFDFGRGQFVRIPADHFSARPQRGQVSRFRS